MNLKTIKRYTYEAIIYLLCLIVLGVFFMVVMRLLRANKFFHSSQELSVNVPFKCDAGVDRYWHVTVVKNANSTDAPMAAINFR